MFTVIFMEGVIKMTTLHRIRNLFKRAGQSARFRNAAKVVKTIVEEVVAEKTLPENPHPLELVPMDTHQEVESVPTGPDAKAIQPAAPALMDAPAYHRPVVPEIDFSRQVNLEEYADELALPRETLEGWLSAGILCPSETKVAEKLIKIIRDKETRAATPPPEAAA